MGPQTEHVCISHHIKGAETFFRVFFFNIGDAFFKLGKRVTTVILCSRIYFVYEDSFGEVKNCCQELLSRTTVKNYCQELLLGTIVRNYCQKLLSGPIVN